MRKWIGLFLGVSLLLAACSRKVMIRKYYILEAEEKLDLADVDLEKTGSFSVEVKDFEVAKAFQQTRMAVRTGSHELNYYFYHRWAIRPGVAAAELLYDLLLRSSVFGHCVRHSSIRLDYIITGSVQALERKVTPHGEFAHLQCLLVLQDPISHKMLVQYSFDREVLLEGTDMNDFAGEISRIFHRETEKFLQRVSTFLESVENK
jgi:ABC-type uncharacterized transport system auxiliary subunit